MSLFQKIKSLFLHPILMPVLALASRPALADGFSKANDLMDKISAGLTVLSVGTITVAVMWVGYKVLWNGQSLKDCGNIIIGAGLIIGGSEFARLFTD
ncbi:trbC/VIRB2 family protein (plasmid) [Yersinia pseudotuberculosis IP 32953]|uniref:TriB Protein n=2 Tax=Yersinia pseudotuberculosis TaxID=633 RepID=Q663E9_YERPS|nr:TrbC/VirB2 family protein [Yersinia pseudotuberculosis]AJJ53082.1 trbC/VIRB2 family protein [Yersinia pseudotuberculosis IP 32953]BET64948.1 TrbC/VirB2 family protein [Yersinia pseudotuberculosis]CAF25447.1 TriB Protein [Yersinia pseudotuberculosis IP 32953]